MIGEEFMSLSLRKANMDDALDILKWRNDEKSIDGSFSKEKIAIPQHMEWYKKKLASDKCHMFILEEDGEKAGLVRVDQEGNVGELSIMIAPEKRGRGFGNEIMALVEKHLPEGVNALVGFVLPDNHPSRKMYLANGYNEFIAGDITCYIKLF